ncbi:MAG: hypothetical protein KGL39_29425 [Patescibacteria group bacterium]|nr:hypothetical protein [Patescibacteria group bacterium]
MSESEPTMNESRCNVCGEPLYSGAWPWCPHGDIYHRDTTTLASPIVVHVSADGSTRFPASTDAPIPPGFEKQELRTIREIEALERRVNREQQGEHERHLAREYATVGAQVEARHKELLHDMRNMSPRGRALAEAAMALTARKLAARPQFQAGFHVEALHYDASNREPQRDITTGWKARKI